MVCANGKFSPINLFKNAPIYTDLAQKLNRGVATNFRLEGEIGKILTFFEGKFLEKIFLVPSAPQA